MVLVAIKNMITGGGSQQKPLLPTDRQNASYSSVDDTSVRSSSLSYEGISNPRVVSDIIIGLSDGLTVPFALTAGLSSLGNTKLVITGGMAELVSGAISMGLGGYLAAKSESEYFNTQLAKESNVYNSGNIGDVQASIAEAMSEFRLSGTTVAHIAADVEKDEDIYSRFMVKVVRGLEEPSEGRELTSALTIGLSYFLGGFVPLIPYFFCEVVQTGLIFSVITMIITLYAFGHIKTILSLGTDTPVFTGAWNGVSMLFTGGFAATAAWLLVRFIE